MKPFLLLASSVTIALAPVAIAEDQDAPKAPKNRTQAADRPQAANRMQGAANRAQAARANRNAGQPRPAIQGPRMQRNPSVAVQQTPRFRPPQVNQDSPRFNPGNTRIRGDVGRDRIRGNVGRDRVRNPDSGTRENPRVVPQPQPDAPTTVQSDTTVTPANTTGDGRRDRGGRDGRGGRDRNNDWRNRDGQNRTGGDRDWRSGGSNDGNWSEARRRRHRGHQNRSWWRSRYNRFVLFGSGYYYWDNGFWFPAYGYDPYYSTYSYDEPIYGYGDLEPGQVVLNVQTELQRLGYYRYAVDGLMGPATRAALAAFQQDNGLAITSAIDGPTLSTLGLR